jgi:hypothetical protein
MDESFLFLNRLPLRVKPVQNLISNYILYTEIVSQMDTIPHEIVCVQ